MLLSGPAIPALPACRDVGFALRSSASKRAAPSPGFLLPMGVSGLNPEVVAGAGRSMGGRGVLLGGWEKSWGSMAREGKGGWVEEQREQGVGLSQ